MPYHLTLTAIARIEDALRVPAELITSNYIAQLASNYRTTVRTIHRHKARIDANLPVGRRSGGPMRAITWKMEQAIKQLLEQMPWFYQDEIADFLFEVFGVQVSQPTISMVLKRIQVTRKKLKVEAAQRNQELRTQWRDDLQYFTADQIICVDESGSDDRTGDRQYGWADSGVRAKVRRWLASRERVSVLPAYTIDGYIKSVTFYGTCTADIFEDFIIDDLLPLCNPYPGPRSVIIMDNASVHQSRQYRIVNACRRRGVWVRFLPPYSPDFNPIEESFGDLKAFIRRYYRRERPNHTNYQGFLEWAIREVGTGTGAARRARAHFRNAGVHGVPDN
jgi:transposase